MRFVVIAAVWIVLVITPAYADGILPPPPAGPSAVDLLPPPPPASWGDQIRFQSIVIGGDVPIDVSEITFSDSRVGTFSGPDTGQDSVEIEFNYTPMHIQSTSAAVPEPGGLLALGTGALGLLGHWHRRRARAGRQSQC